MKAIPVLAAMVYNRPDFLERMVRSIDYPIGKLVIILNAVTAEIVSSVDVIRSLYPDVIVHNPGFGQPAPVNLGFAGGWNYVLRHHMDDWVLVVGNDVQFHVGQLQKIAEYYARHEKDSPPMGVVNTSMGWNVHGVTRHGLNVLGYLDENMYPCYYDDCDHDYRHTLAQRAKLVSYPAEGECTVHVHHEGSATSRNLPPEKAERMAKAFERNEDYYRRKWGGTQTKETFSHPFNNPNLSIKDWALEPGRWKLNSLDG